MNWFGGILKATDTRGRGYTWHNVSFAEAQMILDEKFGSHLREAMYEPYPTSMSTEVRTPPTKELSDA